MKAVKARFDSSSREYDYFAQPGDNPEIGDFIITSFDSDDPDVPGYAGVHALRSATIVGIAVEGAKHKATKPYLLLVPRNLLVQRRAQQRAVIRHEEDRRAARAALLKMMNEQREDAVFEAMAKDNPEAAKLLETLRAPPPLMVIEGN